MQGHDVFKLEHVTVDKTLDIEKVITFLEDPGQLITWTFPYNSDISVPEYDALNQNTWLMPDEYKNIDIAEYILSLCDTDAELQRCGQELLLFQERNLFDLLRYLKYLVDTLRSNCMIWGVGRGSSVASYVLYLLGVHRINSMFYDLDAHEFLR
jgi:DNA polymerase III alpha subunit